MTRFGAAAVMIVLLTLVSVEGLSAGHLGASRSPSPRSDAAEPTPSSSRPTDADAAKTAAEELATLSDAAYQIDCRPNMETLPPFTRFTGVPGMGSAFRILADGRCYIDPTVSDPSLEPWVIELVSP
jgi:hypothetical protein